MKYIKHIILTAFAMVVMMGAWAQTAPTKQSNGTWQFTMPNVNKLLEVEYYPCTLTVAKVGAGSVALAPTSYTLTFSGTNDQTIVVNNYDGTSFSSSTLSMQLGDMLIALCGDDIYPDDWTTADHVSIVDPYVVVTGTFSIPEDITFTNTSNNNSKTITVSCTPNMMGIVADANNSNTYYVMPGTEVTVTATADEYNHFVKWTNEDPAVIDGDATKTFTVTGDTTLTANFAIDTVRLDSVRLTWQVQIGDADPISPTPYVTVNPTAADTMGYVLIPKNADVVITPSTEQKELVSKLDLIPIGAINGKFSVGSNKQVYFSKGNLQYTKSTNVWSFMEHQYSMVETADQNVGADYANQNVVSLFGWGTSGYEHGATCYQPNCTNIYPQNYYAYGDAQKSLFDESGKADWGYNAISNGGNTENSGWRTLTNKEWVWLLGPTYANSSPTPGTNCRTSSTISGTPNARFAKANLFGTIHGLIIFPDNYTHPEGVDAPTGINMKDATSWNANTYTSADWAKMEAAGAVFLPAAGRRPTNVGSSTDDAYTVMYVGNTGCYWSSTDSTNDAQQVLFGSGNNFIVDGSAYRSDGHSVRLVKMATVSASAQTDPYVPARNSDNSWTFKMPTSDLMLRTAWKQDAGLAYAKADTTVYRGLTSTVQNTLTKPNGISVTYSITPESGTTTNNVINPSTGEVTIHGTGIDTVKARFAGNNDYLPDSAMYILRTLEPWKLTLATVGDGTVDIVRTHPDVSIADALVEGSTITINGTGSHTSDFSASYVCGTGGTYTLTNETSGTDIVAKELVRNYSRLIYRANPDPGSSTLVLEVELVTVNNTIEIHGFGDNYSDITITSLVVNGTTLAVTGNSIATVPVLPAGVTVFTENNVVVDGKYNVMPGTEITVTATADEHNHFVKWTNEDPAEIAGGATKTFIVTGDTTLTASFALKTFKLTLYSNYDNMGDVVASATSGLVYNNNSTYTIDTGTVVTLTANANTSDHYHFVNWTDKYSTAIGTSAQMQFTITKDTNITGNFAIDTFEVSFGPLATTQAAADANGSVDFDGDVPSGVVQKVEDNYLVPGTYKVPYNTTLNFAASPDLYYHVTGWSGATQSPTDSSKATLTVTEAKTVSATFAIDTVRLDSVRTNWTVKVDGITKPVTNYVATPTPADTMGYVMIPMDADVVITPNTEQKELVSKLELIDKTPPPATGHALALAVVGEIVGSDGLAYDVADKNNLPTGVTAIAMVAYKDGSNGLAIQLNASPSSMDWSSASSYTGYPAVSGGVATWRLPSKDDWQNMFVGCAKAGDAGKDNWMDPIAGFKDKITATGIEFNSNGYWSPDGSYSWSVDVNLYDTYATAYFSSTPDYYSKYVLGCLAF